MKNHYVHNVWAKHFDVGRKPYKPLQKSAFRKPAKRQRETLIKHVVYGWEFGSFPEIVLKMYGKPLVKQRFAVAFSPYAKTLNSLGKNSVSNECET
jgi:hypothetical protein